LAKLLAFELGLKVHDKDG